MGLSETRAIFAAASHAQRAADFLHGLQKSASTKADAARAPAMAKPDIITCSRSRQAVKRGKASCEVEIATGSLAERPKLWVTSGLGRDNFCRLISNKLPQTIRDRTMRRVPPPRRDQLDLTAPEMPAGDRQHPAVA
jgi:hypothetical protein